jgi:hypothetical protein
VAGAARRGPLTIGTTRGADDRDDEDADDRDDEDADDRRDEDR